MLDSVKHWFKGLFCGLKECPKEAILSHFIPEREYKAECGHTTKLRGSITKFSEEPREIVLLFENGKINFCLHCLEEAIIACAWCGKSIYPDEPITLYRQVIRNSSQRKDRANTNKVE